MTRASLILLAATAALCCSAVAQIPIGDLTASDANVKGAVAMEGGTTRVLSGSNVTAGEATASVRLARGGEVRVCPRSSVSLTASPNGRSLMLAVGDGAIETHYTLAGTADTILTPDFRLLLAGPGTFDFAIATDTKGNTCVRSLQSNTASIIVNETMGDGMYQVGPGGKVLFRNGSVRNATEEIPLDCGCPVPPQTSRAVADLAAASHANAAAVPPAAPRTADITAPPPKENPGEVHVSVDAPFVFHARKPNVPPPPVVARVRLQTVPAILFTPPVQPPPTASKLKPIKKALRHVGSFMSGLFK